MPIIYDNIDQRLLPALSAALTLSGRSDFCVGTSPAFGRAYTVWQVVAANRRDRSQCEKSPILWDATIGTYQLDAMNISGMRLAWRSRSPVRCKDGAIVFREACKLGCEGIVSKRLGSIYRGGPVAGLGEGQKSESACRKARGGGGLGTVDLIIGKSHRTLKEVSGPENGELCSLVLVLLQ
jgi:hypothetical protein